MPGESYRRRLRSLFLYLCYVFRALINSLVRRILKAANQRPVLSQQLVGSLVKPKKSSSCPSRVQELCEGRGGRPGLSVLMSLTVSVDVKQHWTMLRHWSQFVPNMSTDIRGHEALHHHQMSISEGTVRGRAVLRHLAIIRHYALYA